MARNHLHQKYAMCSGMGSIIRQYHAIQWTNAIFSHHTLQSFTDAKQRGHTHFNIQPQIGPGLEVQSFISQYYPTTLFIVWCSPFKRCKSNATSILEILTNKKASRQKQKQQHLQIYLIDYKSLSIPDYVLHISSIKLFSLQTIYNKSTRSQ